MSAVLSGANGNTGLVLAELFRMIFEKVDKVGSAGVIVRMLENFGAPSRTGEWNVIDFSDAGFRTIRHKNDSV